MGLDITAYSRLTPAAEGQGFHPEFQEDPDWTKGYFRLRLNDDFPGRAEEIVSGAVYSAAETMQFRAGSYSGYNTWRDQLAEMCGYAVGVTSRGEPSRAATVWADPQPGPFVELINFSDCEGVIGSTISAKLARDFAEFQERADAHPDEYFREKYADWRKAFELASDGGAVAFH